jgi:hypothetical protein
MKKQKYCFVTCLILFFFIPHVHAQQIAETLNMHSDSLPQEKVYLHFDKSYYNPGETIWFKAYIYNGIEPSLVSKNFFVEMIDDSGIVISRKTMPVGESTAAGSFDIAANFTKPLVYIRAYTTWMLNNDSSFFFSKPIRIVNKALSNVKNRGTLQADIRFFPEGGDLIAGIPSLVAYAITDQFGNPASGKGYIKAGDKKLDDFAPLHDGMGTFTLEPAAGVTYTAVWKDATGKEHSTALPPVKPEGVILSVTEVEGRKNIIVKRSTNATDANKSLRLIGVMNQQLVYSAKADLTTEIQTSGNIPTAQFPSGVLQVTVLNKDNIPVAERITFINNHEYEFDADAWIPVTNTSKRGLNKGEVMISDTVHANLSLSITDADLNIPTVNEDNIISRLLLTGDLRGKIANPYYYFFSTADSAKYHLDLVMLTHGWRRYNWSDIVAGKPPVIKIKETNYLSLTGNVIGIDPSRLPSGTEINMIMKAADSSSAFITLPVDRRGHVNSDGFIFYDNADLYFQFNEKKASIDKSMLKLDNGLWKGYNSIRIDDDLKNAVLNLDTVLLKKNLKNAASQLLAANQRKKKEQMLQEVVVTAKGKTEAQKLDEKYSSGLFSGGDAKSFDVANDPMAVSSQTVFQYLQGKVAGLQITNANAGGTEPQLSWRGGTPVYYLNEMPTDVSMMQSLSMNDVAYIKVFNPASGGAISSKGGGTIVVYTKKGGDVKNTDAKGLNSLKITGYSVYKEFYSPDYATSSPLNDVDDLRTTLFWAPYIILDKKTKRYKFQFYNNDISRRFRIILEGINEDGKLIHIEKQIE